MVEKPKVYYFLIALFFSLHPIIAMETPLTRPEVPIKMGIELELQDIVYVNEAEITLVDHLRLFESESTHEGEPDWYLEVDGSENLEFVTRPFILTNESERELLRQAIENIHRLSHYILSNSKNPQSLEDPYIFRVNKGTVISGVGRWVLKADDKNLLPQEISGLSAQKTIKIDIKNPMFKVRPQATFEFPFSLMPNFANYMASPKHKKLFNAVKNVKKVERLEDFSDNDYGFQYLILLYSELLKGDNAGSELGPKGQLALMSRKSFSSYIFDEEGGFAKLHSLFSHEATLFGAPYNIYFDGDNLAEVEEVKSFINSVTIHQWLDSMVDPGLSNHFRENAKQIWERISQEKLSSDARNKPAQVIMKQIREGLFNSNEDLLSSPLFINNKYSMGKIIEKNKNAVLEMRGYTAEYSNNMKMGDLVRLWVKREVDNALAQWRKEYLSPLTEFKVAFDGINSIIDAAEWKKKENILTDILAMTKAPLKIIKFSPEFIRVPPNFSALLVRHQQEIENEFYKYNPRIVSEISVQKKEFGLSSLESRMGR